MSIKKAQYRLRVYQLEDQTTVLVFGDEPAPENAKLIVDQDVSETVVVTPHVEA